MFWLSQRSLSIIRRLNGKNGDTIFGACVPNPRLIYWTASPILQGKKDDMSSKYGPCSLVLGDRLWKSQQLPFNSCWNVHAIHNLSPNTIHITRCHLELSYPLVSALILTSDNDLPLFLQFSSCFLHRWLLLKTVICQYIYHMFT